LLLPPRLAGMGWRDALTGASLRPGARLKLADVLRQLPVGLLESA
jgi:maltooligosyltrehalose synthase